MKCIKCGAQLSEGMAFCPACGAAQNENIQGSVNNQQSGYSNSNTYQSQEQQQWQQPQPQPQQQQQWQSQQSQPQQQWQPQQPYSQYQQQNNAFAQNNLQYGNDMTVKKSSKKPLIIGLIAAIIIIIGLAVTCVVLIISKDSSSKGGSNTGTSGSLASTPEKTVEGFLDTLLDWNFSEAVDKYMHPVLIEQMGGRDEALDECEDIGTEISSYDDMSSKKLSSDELNSLNKYLRELDYDYKITEGSVVKVHIEGPGIGRDNYYVTFYVVNMDGKWYIIDWVV